MSLLPKKTPLIQVVNYKLNFLARHATSSLRVLPDFLIIGAAKAGTTSLYNYLMQHKRILPCLKKEVHYFDRHFKNNINWYKAHFPLKSEMKYGSGQELLSGESSPYYLFHPLSAQRIKSVIPTAKFFIVLRNPVDRAVSHYNHRVRAGQEKLTIKESFEKEGKRLEGEEELLSSGKKQFSFNHYYYSYISRGIYAEQLKKWFNYFDRKQFLILESNELFFEPEKAFNKALNHLNLTDTSSAKFKKYNSGEMSEYTNLDVAHRKQLVEFYRPHNDELFKLINQSFDWNK